MLARWRCGERPDLGVGEVERRQHLGRDGRLRSLDLVGADPERRRIPAVERREYSRTASRPRARTSAMIPATVSRTCATSAAALGGAFFTYSLIAAAFRWERRLEAGGLLADGAGRSQALDARRRWTLAGRTRSPAPPCLRSPDSSAALRFGPPLDRAAGRAKNEASRGSPARPEPGPRPLARSPVATPARDRAAPGTDARSSASVTRPHRPRGTLVAMSTAITPSSRK